MTTPPRWAIYEARGVLINASPIVRGHASRCQRSSWRTWWPLAGIFTALRSIGVPQRILVLGASGYIGQHLVRR
jgi:hypothetical protein